VRGGDQGDVAVPADPGPALEVVQAQAGLEFAVVVLDPPADFGVADQVDGVGVGGQARQPVLDRLRLAVRPLGDQPSLGQQAVGIAGQQPAVLRSFERDGDDVGKKDAALPVSWRRWTGVIQRARR
jgi:hypothetical protein